MSTARTGLPTSLTPKVLRDVLRYEPRHWKAIKARIAKKRRTLCEDMNVSSDDFYDKLHELLKDPENRQTFELAAKSSGTRNRTGSLFRRISKHYIDPLRHEESFRECIHPETTSRELIDAVSEHDDDDDHLANLVWAVLEDGGLSEDELAEISAEYPGVGERLQTVVDTNTMEEQRAPNQWEDGLSRLREALDSANAQRSKTTLVAQLAELVEELREVALADEAERSDAFASSLAELMRQHASVLSDQRWLKPYVDRIDATPREMEIPEDETGFVEKFDRTVRSLGEVVERQREKGTAVAEADAQERTRLLGELHELHAAESEQRARLESLFLQLFGESVPGVAVETTDVPVTPAPTGTLEHARGSDEPCDKFEVQRPSADSKLEDNEASDQREESDPPAKDSAEASSTDEPSAHILSEDDLSPSTVEGSSQAGATETATSAVADDADATGGIATSDTAPARADDPPESVTSSSEGESHSQSVALEALNAMLSSRRFGRAYWLTRADRRLGDPALLGALSEGAQMGPGDSCSGALAHFFNSLAGRKHWHDDERLLLSASVLSSCLFVDPLPQDIYLLAGELPDDSSATGHLMKRVRELCIFRNAKIRPRDLGAEPADAARTARLDQLRSDADQFLKRVPHMRFQYAPADFAVQYLYRAGSEWHRLHTIVIGDQISRLNEARSLLNLLEPSEVVGALHDDPELTAVKQPLDGRARDKLCRHLHDTLALAGEWTRLAAATDNDDKGGSRTQATELLSALETALPNARKALESNSGRGAANALYCVIADVEARIQGNVPKACDSIGGNLRLLPGLVLEDDLEPAEKELDHLRSAILDAEQLESKPQTVLSECLSRREYRRAREIIETCELGNEAQTEYERAVSGDCATLEETLHELELEIEDAFLLGELRDQTDDNDTSDSQVSSTLERSQLIGVVRESRRKLSQSDDSVGDEIRTINRNVDDVANKVEELRSKRQERLRDEFSVVINQLPDSEQGKADRDYLRGSFDECIESNDHVAAFDLLDRGRRAVQGPGPVVRASTGSSEDLELFLKRADGYRDALSKREALPGLEADIIQGNTFAEIAFGQLDRNRREEAVSAFRTWHSLTQLRFPSAHRALKDSLEELLRFIGLPLQEGGAQVVDTTQPGFAHVRATLSRPVTSSPLPAFGSACGCRYEVVVSQTRKEPEQVEEYTRGRRLEGHPVLVLLLLPHTARYRIRWQRHFARAQLTVLPLDSVFLLHLCGERNRLPVLFELGLPFTWARPYITKGENVAVEMFVGRRNETAALIDRHGSCIVFGGRQLGKSALLRHVLREHHAPENSVYVVYLDVDDLGTDSEGHDAMLPVFWRRVYDELVRCAAIPELSQKILNKDARLVEEIPNRIATRLSEDPYMQIVLLLDETDCLLDCDSARDFALVRRLRSLMADTDRRFKAVFAGLQSVQRYHSWKNHPFAQLGNELVINPLPPAAAQELIIRPLRALGFAFEDTRLVLRILSQTNYHPGLIQIIGYRLLDNLFEKWQRQDTVGPIRPIVTDDVLSVERDASVMDDIRRRFDWTLDLDDRYKVLTYALVLTSDPTAPHREAEFMAIGAEWWKAVFKDMDTLGLRAVLDEMVGLGVLLREQEESVRKYRLRSPNLLRLLGPRETMEDELFRIIERRGVSRSNPRNFHPVVDRKAAGFGPLTNEQVGQIYGQRRPFQLTLVTGSEALGLNAVERQFDKLLGESGDGDRDKAWRKVNYTGPTIADGFITKLRDSFKSRRRTHRYAVVRLSDILYEGRLSTLFDRIVRELGQICTNQSKAHLALLLDPHDTWRWLRDRKREQVLSQSRVTGIELRRWSDGAIANAFDNIDARTGSQVAGEEVFKLTSGFHSLVSEGLSRAQPRASIKAGTLIAEWEAMRDEMLTDARTEPSLLSLGLRGTDLQLESCVSELLSLREETDDGRLVLTDISFALAADQLEEEAQQLLKNHGVEIRDWIRTMDLARPLNTSDKGSMVIAPWVDEMIQAAGG